MHILVVEDDRGISSFLEKGLRAEGYSTSTVTSGREASAYLDEHGHVRPRGERIPRRPRWGAQTRVARSRPAKRPGFDVLMELRSSNAALPVIVLTARAETADKVTGLDLGANASRPSAGPATACSRRNSPPDESL